MKKPESPSEFRLPGPLRAGGHLAPRAVVGGFPWAHDTADSSGESTAGPLGSSDQAATSQPRFPGSGSLPTNIPHASAPGRLRSGRVGDAVRPEPLADRLTDLVRRSPAWAFSLSLHCLLFLLLALWVVQEKPLKKLRLRLAFGSAPVTAVETGIDIGPPREPTEEPDEERTEIAETVRPPVASPQAAPAAMPEPVPTPGPAAKPAVAPAVGMLLTGRDAGRKQVLLGAAGGSDATEAAVGLALGWLRKQQNQKDGLWSLQGPYDDGGSQENRLAATAMALLAFQGAGNTLTEGPHHEVVARGWRSLLKAQQQDGVFDVDGGQIPVQHSLYSHAQVTMALCELYGMTRDPKLAEPAARAVAYCIAAQGPNGGWRYEPGKPGDMSVTGWYMMALKTAEMAGMDVPAATFAGIGGFLDTVANDRGTAYGYRRDSPLKPPGPVTAAVSAEGLLCRQYLGWPQQDPRLVEGLELLMAANPIDFAGGMKDVYAWYYITQVAHHIEGEPWRRWNDRLREELPREQVAKGRQRGSWDPSLDRWGHIGGRLFMTSFCTLMLETYYRHLPLYAAQGDLGP